MDFSRRLASLRWGGVLLIVAGLGYFDVTMQLAKNSANFELSPALLGGLFGAGIAGLGFACVGALRFGGEYRGLDNAFGVVFLLFALNTIAMTLIAMLTQGLFGDAFSTVSLLFRFGISLAPLIVFGIAFLCHTSWIRVVAIVCAAWIGVNLLIAISAEHRYEAMQAQMQADAQTNSVTTPAGHIAVKTTRSHGYRDYVQVFLVLSLVYCFVIRPKLATGMSSTGGQTGTDNRRPPAAPPPIPTSPSPSD